MALALFEATRCKLILAGRSLAGDSAAPFDLAGERHRARQVLGPDATLSEITSEVETRRRVNEVLRPSKHCAIAVPTSTMSTRTLRVKESWHG